jgi:hypothetical protein
VIVASRLGCCKVVTSFLSFCRSETRESEAGPLQRRGLVHAGGVSPFTVRVAA